MRIPSIESDKSQAGLAKIDAKVLALVESIKQQPLLIEKLILSDKNTLSLYPQEKTSVSQIQLPLKYSQLFSAQAESQFSVKLSTKGNQVLLAIIPGIQSNSTSTNLIQLLFGKANLLNNTILNLSRQIPSANSGQQFLLPAYLEQTAISQPQNAAILQNKISSANLNLTNALLLSEVEKNNQASLSKAIEQFLVTKPQEQQVVAKSLDQMLNNSNALLRSFNTVNTTHENTLPALGNKAIAELINKLQSDSTEGKFYQNLSKLFQLSSQLQSTLEFSSTNRQLDIAKRFANSGNFLESRLAHLTSETLPKKAEVISKTLKTQSSGEQTIKQNVLTQFTKQLPNNSTSLFQDKLASGGPQDIKFVVLQIKQLLQSLSQALMSNHPNSIQANRLVEQLIKQPVIQQYLNPANPQKLSQSQNPAMAPPDSELLLSELRKICDSSALKRMPWADLYNGVVKLPGLTVKQEALLLIQQRLLIGEMLNDTNSIIHKIETNQLLSLRSESSLLQQLLVEVPIYRAGHLDSFEVLYQSKQNQEEPENNRSWTVTVKFDLAPLGPMFAKVSLQNDRISTHFFAREASTAKLLADNIQHLQQSLFAAGVDVDEIKGQQGIVPDELISKDKHKVDIKV